MKSVRICRFTEKCYAVTVDDKIEWINAEECKKEHYEQVNVFKWAAGASFRWPALKLMYAIPNAAKRSLKLGAYMKAEGLKSGVPDIHLPVASGDYIGLFIEMKTEKGRATKNQMQWMLNLTQAGHLCKICRGANEAINTITKYLEGKI